MAQITITGTIILPDATFPADGSLIAFELNGYFRNSDDELVNPTLLTVAIDDSDGTFTIDLESSLDGIPSTRFYEVSVLTTLNGDTTKTVLGKIQIPSTPSDQDIKDLLETGITSDVTGRQIFRETPGGTKDGTNLFFTLARTPQPNTEMLFIGSNLLIPGVSYTISGRTITFTAGNQPLSTDEFVAWYTTI